MTTYAVFTRTWWRYNPAWPNGLEPCAGKKKYLRKGITSEESARDIARVWNANNKPGRLSRKADYEESN